MPSDVWSAADRSGRRFFPHEFLQQVLASGAVPNEKITWGKLGIDTPKYIIESDATIVAPLLFAYLLGW